MAELNDLLATAMATDDRRRIAHRPIPVGEHFALEAQVLRPLPGEGFDTTVVSSHRVDRKARVSVRGGLYSVPARYVARRVEVRVGAESVDVVDGTRVIATHARARKGDEVLVLDHYLEVLALKPGAMPSATPLARARASGAFSDTHERFWAQARRRLRRRRRCRHARRPRPRRSRPGGRRDRGSQARPRLDRCGPPHRDAGPLRPPAADPRRLRRPPGGPMTSKMTDTAAVAAIGAATRELRLPVVRTDAARLAEIAQRSQQSYLAFLAEVLSAEVDERAERRRQRRVTEARFPRPKRLTDFDLGVAPTINPATIATLASCAYLQAAA